MNSKEVLKTRQHAENRVTYVKPHITKPRLNFSMVSAGYFHPMPQFSISKMEGITFLLNQFLTLLVLANSIPIQAVIQAEILKIFLALDSPSATFSTFSSYTHTHSYCYHSHHSHHHCQYHHRSPNNSVLCNAAKVHFLKSKPEYII